MLTTLWNKDYKIKLNANIKRVLLREKLEKQFNKKLNEIKNKKIINIVFYVSEKAKWSTQSLFEELKKDKRFSVKIAVQNPYNEEIKFFQNLDAEVVPVYQTNGELLDILTLSPDIVFYQQPWEICEINKIERISEKALTAYVPYGYMAIKSDGAHYFLPFHFHLWRYFCENDKQKKLFIKKNKLLKNILYNSGYPKIDVYFDYKPQNTSRKTIIWAPHWSFGDNFVRFGTFDKNCEFFYELAKNNPNINWIYKPHPGLICWIEKTKFMTKIEYQKYLEKWYTLPNAKIVTDGNYFDTFFESDALVTDSISFLFEYLPTKKPIIYIDSKRGCDFNETTKPIVKSYYKVTTNEEIENIIKKVVKDGNDYKYKERMKHLKNFIDNKTPAGKNIAKYLRNILEIGDSND